MPSAHSKFSEVYTYWLDQWVVLKVATGKSQTELVCTVVAESDAALRIRIADTCEVDIYKDMILGVSQAWPALIHHANVEEPLFSQLSDGVATLEIRSCGRERKARKFSRGSLAGQIKSGTGSGGKADGQ
jgi:hypothetical protein